MKSNPDIIWLDVAESSNDEARRAIDSLDNLSVVAVRCQTKGRGQRTNTWETAPGQNLTFSVVLKDFEILPKEQIAISQITALSVVDFLRMHGIESNIKLPNDIYVGNKKICGILIENSVCSNRLRWSIVGIGINVNQTTFPSSLPNPTSILLEKSNPELDLTQQLAKFHEIYSAYYTKYLSSRNESALTEVDYLFKSKLISL
jgi:BirA family biotin operon repressor/biotin-[acetyl-CoA-carboxylase] ligase